MKKISIFVEQNLQEGNLAHLIENNDDKGCYSQVTGVIVTGIINYKVKLRGSSMGVTVGFQNGQR